MDQARSCSGSFFGKSDETIQPEANQKSEQYTGAEAAILKDV